MEEIIKITSEEFHKLLESRNENGVYSPIGLYYIEEGDGTFTGIDNLTGDAWTTNFITLDLCVKWLNREIDLEDLEFNEEKITWTL